MKIIRFGFSSRIDVATPLTFFAFSPIKYNISIFYLFCAILKYIRDNEKNFPLIYLFFSNLSIFYYYLKCYLINTTLHNGMILSTLSISSHDFALCFSKDIAPMKIVFLDYKPMIIS